MSSNPQSTAVSEYFEPVYAWQEAAWKQLTESSSKGALAHAHLIAGRAGTAKHRFAMQFAVWLLCQNKLPNHACAHCQSCTWIKAQTHPDILNLIPAADSKSQTIRIDEIRDVLVPFANQRGSGYRIIYVPEAAQINLASANALLKLLEEPPARCQFILVSEQPNKLLPTLLSRLQRVDAAAPSIEQSTAYLQSYGVEHAAERLKLANYSPLSAAELNLQGKQKALNHTLLIWQALRAGQRDPASATSFWLSQGSMEQYFSLLDQILVEAHKYQLGLELSLDELPWERLDPAPNSAQLLKIERLIAQSRSLLSQNILEQNTLDQLHHLLAQS